MTKIIAEAGINPNGRFILHYMQPHRPFMCSHGGAPLKDVTEVPWYVIDTV